MDAPILLTDLPVLYRVKYYADTKSWEFIAVFPTIPADSSSWYNMQAQAENGDWFSCSHEFYHSTKPAHSKRFAALMPRFQAWRDRVRKDWRDDNDYPCSLIERNRISSEMQDARKRNWKEARK